MVESRLFTLMLHHSAKIGRRVTLRLLAQDTGLSTTTLQKLSRTGVPVERIDARTIEALCKYFGCDLGDLLKIVPDPQASG